jgi:hypothetical protein
MGGRPSDDDEKCPASRTCAGPQANWLIVQMSSDPLFLDSPK